jgi:hypothetical protein
MIFKRKTSLARRASRFGSACSSPFAASRGAGGWYTLAQRLLGAGALDKAVENAAGAAALGDRFGDADLAVMLVPSPPFSRVCSFKCHSTELLQERALAAANALLWLLRRGG